MKLIEQELKAQGNEIIDKGFDSSKSYFYLYPILKEKDKSKLMRLLEKYLPFRIIKRVTWDNLIDTKETAEYRLNLMLERMK